jgi:hypothetical protein
MRHVAADGLTIEVEDGASNPFVEGDDGQLRP